MTRRRRLGEGASRLGDGLKKNKKTKKNEKAKKKPTKKGKIRIHCKKKD